MDRMPRIGSSGHIYEVLVVSAWVFAMWCSVLFLMLAVSIRESAHLSRLMVAQEDSVAVAGS